MKLILLCLLAFPVLLATSAYGQENIKCDVKILRQVSEKMGTLTQPEITTFLSTFGKECKSNAEYSNWSNDLLLVLLDVQTEVTLKTIEESQSQFELDVILDNLDQPVTDRVNVKTLAPKVQKVSMDEGLKKRIVAKLN